MTSELDPSTYAAWFRSELGRRVWRDERRALDRALGDVAGRTVLDVGAGEGRLAAELAARGARVVAVDRSADMLTAAGTAHGSAPGFDRVRADAMALPFPDGSFDVAVAVTVLCFAEEPQAMARELTRVARPGERVVLGELARWSPWALARRIRGWLDGGLWSTARFRTAADLRKILAGAGLRPGRVHGAVYYPRSVLAARLMAGLERWLSQITTVGAAFLAAAGVKEKRSSNGNLSTQSDETRT